MLLGGLVAACASQGPPERRGPPQGHGGREAGSPARPSLFISPAGEPFRAGPGQPYPSAAWFARADANHDGRLDRAEVRADAAAYFHVLDANHDGAIDSFEVSDYEQRIAPEILGAYRGGEGRPQRGERPGDGGPDGHGRRGGEPRGERQADPSGGGGEGDDEGAAPFEFTDEPEPVMAADLALDGRITLDEFLRTVDRRFDALDKAQTGAVALADLPRTRSQQMGAVERRGGEARRRGRRPGDD